MNKKYVLILCCVFFSFFRGKEAVAQNKVLDGVIAVVGANPILQSELEAKKLQSKHDSLVFNTCTALEDLLYQKLLFAQAIKDSVEVSDEQVEDELERKLRQYIPQFGSIKAFEAFLGKSVEKYKEEVREDMREVLLVQKMQAKITDGITVSPAEVKEFFEDIPKDSIPLVNAEVEVGHIVKVPKVDPLLKKYAKDKIAGLRDDIITGRKDFADVAFNNSDDPGSAKQGGCYTNIQRGTFVPEFDAVAFRMKENEISDVFETSYGYHILKVKSRRGEEIDVCHILITPQPSSDDMLKAKTFLDSIAGLVKKDSISITEAASRFSDDEETKMHGGLISNPYTGSTKFEMDQLGQIDQFLVFTTDKLKVGELSAPSLTQSREGQQVYHIVYVKSRTEPHRANLKDDYQRIQEEALAAKKEKAINAWVKKKIASTYLHISDEYKNCKFDNKWVN